LIVVYADGTSVREDKRIRGWDYVNRLEAIAFVNLAFFRKTIVDACKFPPLTSGFSAPSRYLDDLVLATTYHSRIYRDLYKQKSHRRTVLSYSVSMAV
jgi:hypothetical protein